MTILVVDDEPLLRLLGSAILEKDGFDVLLAANGSECLEHHKSGKDIALTILDFHMPPGPTGKVVYESLIKISPAAKVRLASGTADAEVIDRMVEREMCSSLRKPYRPAELLEAVHAALASCDPVKSREENSG